MAASGVLAVYGRDGGPARSVDLPPIPMSDEYRETLRGIKLRRAAHDGLSLSGDGARKEGELTICPEFSANVLRESVDFVA